MNILALIPARSGSKSIPLKNVTPLGGHPLIAYSIAAARESKKITRTIVSTDSKKIADIAKTYGGEAPFLRPKNISQDNSLDRDFFIHALDWLKENENYVPDMIIHLRPTTPLRDPKVIDKAIDEMQNDKQATALRSAHEHPNPGYKLFRKKGEYINFFGKDDFKPGEEYYNYPRQNLPKTYNPNGYVDIVLPRILQSTNSLHGTHIRAFITEKIADIDTQEDIPYAEELLKTAKYAIPQPNKH